MRGGWPTDPVPTKPEQFDDLKEPFLTRDHPTISVGDVESSVYVKEAEDYTAEVLARPVKKKERTHPHGCVINRPGFDTQDRLRKEYQEYQAKKAAEDEDEH